MMVQIVLVIIISEPIVIASATLRCRPQIQHLVIAIALAIVHGIYIQLVAGSMAQSARLMLNDMMFVQMNGIHVPP